MAPEQLDTFRFILTRIRGTEPVEVAFFLRDRDGNVIHSGSKLFSDVRAGFKAGFNTPDDALAKLETQVLNNRDVDQVLRDVSYTSLRLAGLLPPIQDPPKPDIELHVKTPRQ
jgi:hypothetical protein